MLSHAVAMTPASPRQLFQTFSAVRNLPSDRRNERLDAVEQQALLERGERFDRLFRTALYMARLPGRQTLYKDGPSATPGSIWTRQARELK